MKNRKFILLAILSASIAVPTAARADRLEISVGDRGFYTQAARYWDGDYERIWIPATGPRAAGFTVTTAEASIAHGDRHDAFFRARPLIAAAPGQVPAAQ